MLFDFTRFPIFDPGSGYQASKQRVLQVLSSQHSFCRREGLPLSRQPLSLIFSKTQTNPFYLLISATALVLTTEASDITT